ncbi:folate-binding protein YgfZ [Luteimonas sp. SJ-92]|uniref:Folate-binding protein YgfZ n=1 Tax=Luteimonas salinisoli TaxID=2752307 RepID=A0A853JEP8_9GAMM|nr:folate-binding protein YgfZ [Luteimonas salinisoli]NZA27030.1 folate-binding protein YgfZ [Luteimonas salinisoli]
MSHKSTPAGGDFFAIPDHAVLTLEGRDAAKFAQAQFMNDVAALAPGHWQWNGWLTPKGRVTALFALLKQEDERLWLLLADAASAGFAEALSRFVFRSKVRIRIVDGLHAAGAFAAPDRARGAAFDGGEGAGIELDFGTPAGARTLAIGEAAAAEDADALARWNAFDLAHGRPRLDAAQAGQWTPQQLSLQRLVAYSVKKGCYPGQEIVARTHFLGQAKRGLARLACEAEIASGSAVTAGGKELGRVVCSGAGELLAVLPLERSDDSLAVDGAPCVPQPLLEGLAR